MIGLLAPILLAASSGGMQAEEPFERPELGSRVKKKRITTNESRHYLNLYVKCVEGRHRKKVEQLLQLESLSEEQVMLLGKIAGLHDRSSCTRTGIAYNLTTFRGAVAEQWYTSKYSRDAPEVISSATPYLPDMLESVNRIVSVPEDARAQIIVEEFAICVAATQPMKVDQLLRTGVNSDEERQAVSQLSAKFGSCAIEGQKLTFNYETLRAGLGYAMARKTLGIVPSAEKTNATEAVN